MKILSAVAMTALLASTAAYSAEMMSSVPSSSKTVTDSVQAGCLRSIEQQDRQN